VVKKMSDPMTNSDVEDVLASIRRLVSDNTRTGSAAVQQPPGNRLVLTPSLRVPEADEPEDAAAEPEEAAEAADTDETATEQDDRLSKFAKSAFAGNKPEGVPRIDVRAQGFVPADPDAVVAALSADLTEDHTPAAAADAETADVPQADTDGDTANDEAPDEEEETLAHTAQNDKAAPIASSVAAAEPDAPDIAAQAAQVPEDWANEVDGVTSVPEPPEDDAAKPSPEMTEKPISKSLSEKIAALETLVGDRRDQFEPDDPGVDAYAGTEPPAMEWEDAEMDDDPVDIEEAQSVDVAAEPESGMAEPAEPAQVTDKPARNQPARAASPEASENRAQGGAAAALFTSDDDVLDEDALRELISDIVRQELQGALGERITRNVRKLVRREIHRALAAQDLE